MSCAIWVPSRDEIFHTSDFHFHSIRIEGRTGFLCYEGPTGPGHLDTIEETLSGGPLKGFYNTHILDHDAFLIDPLKRAAYLLSPQELGTSVNTLPTVSRVIGSFTGHLNTLNTHCSLPITEMARMFSDISGRNVFVFNTATGILTAPTEKLVYLPSVGEFEPCTCDHSQNALHDIKCPAVDFLPINWKAAAKALMDDRDSMEPTTTIRSTWGLDASYFGEGLPTIANTRKTFEVYSTLEAGSKLSIQGDRLPVYYKGTMLEISHSLSQLSIGMVVLSTSRELHLMMTRPTKLKPKHPVTVVEFEPWGE